MKQYILALDQGTTSSRCIIFDEESRVVSTAQREFTQIFPQPGYVEHDAMEILDSQLSVAALAMEMAGLTAADIAAIGITNQRETTVLWDKETGRPVFNAIVWQCRRTAGIIEQLKDDGLAEYARKTTGLIPDAYFSASKIAWILRNVPEARALADAGRLLFGTIDTWLIWNLTGGAVHATDVTNASRTMLYDIHALRWDPALLAYFGIPAGMMPEVVMSSGIVGRTRCDALGDGIPIAGIAGDQQSALFGQCCFSAGDVKNTYGTGCFTLMNTKDRAITSESGLLTTIACGIGGQIDYALEGSVFIAGAAIQWLRDELRVLQTAAESEAIAKSAADTGGVYVVPAFSGLGAPYWNPYARGIITGLTRGTTREQLICATLNSLAFQVYDLIMAMQQDAGVPLGKLLVDGGASANNYLMQFQADLLNIPVVRPQNIETTALGAAYLAGLGTGFWKSREDIAVRHHVEGVFTSQISDETRKSLLSGWKKALKCALLWAED